MKFRRIAVAVAAVGAFGVVGTGVAQAAPVNDTASAQGSEERIPGYGSLRECMDAGAVKTDNGAKGGFQCIAEDDGTQTLEIYWP